MEFYYGNNLIKEDFLSALVSWKFETDWKLKAVGFPYLALNIHQKALYLNFMEKKGSRDIFSYNVTRLNVSTDPANGTLLLETRDGLEDFGIAFSGPEAASRFFALLVYYQDLSSIIRFVFVETDLPKWRN